MALQTVFYVEDKLMNEEYFDIYSIDKKPLGRISKRGNQLPNGEYHFVVLAIIVNHNKLLITRRSLSKKGAPGKWECTAGSVLAGESCLSAIKREVFEEVGIPIETIELLIHTYIEDDAIFEFYLVNTNYSISDLKLDENEVDKAMYVNKNQLEDLIKNDMATLSIIEVYQLINCGIIQIK
jgi:8-oxo-dGTP diphosphatase